MIAVDTNVIGPPADRRRARQEAAAQIPVRFRAVWIAKTVLLETGWVLRSLYGFEEPAIRDAFTKLLGLKNVRAEDEVIGGRGAGPHGARN